MLFSFCHLVGRQEWVAASVMLAGDVAALSVAPIVLVFGRLCC